MNAREGHDFGNCEGLKKAQNRRCISRIPRMRVSFYQGEIA